MNGGGWRYRWGGGVAEDNWVNIQIEGAMRVSFILWYELNADRYHCYVVLVFLVSPCFFCLSAADDDDDDDGGGGGGCMSSKRTASSRGSIE